MSERGGYRGGRGGGRGGPARGPPPRRDGAAETPQIENRGHRSQLKEDFTQFFNSNNIEMGSTELEAKMEPGKLGKERRQFLTNAFGVKTENEPIYQYHITIDAARKPNDPKPTYLTKQQNDDCIASDRKARCREAFNLMLRIADDIFLKDNRYFYDLQSTLLTTKTFKQNGEDNNDFTFTFAQNLLAPIPLLSNFFSLKYHIKRCNVERPLTTGDMSMATLTNYEEFNRSHQAFIELATSKRALMNPAVTECLSGGKIYLVQPENFVDPSAADAANQFAPDKYIGLGCKKSAKYVEGPKGRGSKNVALFIDPIKTPFFRSLKIIDFLTSKNVDPFNRSKAITVLKNLHVYNPYLSGKKTFQITSVHQSSSGQYTFKNAEGRETSVAQYFFEKYGVKCDPRLPVVCGKGRTDTLPMDVALIDDNQPVPKNKMGPYEGAKMIKLAAQAPSVQMQEIEGYRRALGLDALNINDDTLRIIPNPLKVDGRILQNPCIVYSDERANSVPGTDGTWHLPKNSLRPGSIKAWALIHNGHDRVDLARFEAAFVRQCKNINMDMPDRALYYDSGTGDPHDLQRQFEKAKQEGVDFMVFITDKGITNQGEIKLLEREFEITTQNITTRVACDAYDRGTATLQNIVNKTNVKAGGLNYSVKVNEIIIETFGNNCIIIGIALSHAGSIDAIQKARGGATTADKLSSIGYAANTGKNFFEFFGDHTPNTAYRSEILDCIPGIIEKTLVQYRENKGYDPTTMVLYLNGSSEGEFPMLKRFEVPLVRKTIKDVLGSEIPITVVIPQRSHVARIYKTDVNRNQKAAQQNLQPGVVIDTGLVHPAANEFYLNSHVAIQGTARTPKYTLLFNNNPKLTMDSIQRLTYDLTYTYQIINSPISLPAAVYIAQQYAERGSKLYITSGVTDAEKAVQTLRYESVETFRNRRLNA